MMKVSFPNTCEVEWTWKLRLSPLVRMNGQHGLRLSCGPVAGTGIDFSCFQQAPSTANKIVVERWGVAGWLPLATGCETKLTPP